MKKDIVFLCQFFYPEKVSSALLPYQTAVSMVEKGFTVDVMCGYPKEYVDKEMSIQKSEVKKGIKIYRKKYLQLGRMNKISRLVNYFSFTIVMCLNLFKFKKYKVIVVYSNPPIIPVVAILANVFFGTKIIFVAYDVYPEIAESMNILNANSVISKTMTKINEQLYKRVSNVVALSLEMKEYIIANRSVDKENVIVIPNWATEEKQEGNGYLSTPDFKILRQKYKLIVSYFGNMGTAQDMDTIQNVISNFKLKDKKIGFLFAGHGNKKQQLKKFINDNELVNCYVYDYLSGNEFDDALKITDINIVSLESKLSGLAVPSKTYSYYQSGSPVISIMSKDTDISKEIQENNCGIAVENNESEVIIDWLLEVSDKPEKITIMRDNVLRLHEKKYLKNYQMEKYKDIITEILSEESHV